MFGKKEKQSILTDVDRAYYESMAKEVAEVVPIVAKAMPHSINHAHLDVAAQLVTQRRSERNRR